MAMKVVLEILTPLALTRREDGKIIFDLWQEYLPALLPEKVGNWEPLDRPFDSRNMDTVFEAWKWPFFATRTIPPSVDASFLMRKGQQQRLHATVIFRFDAEAAEQAQLVSFLKALSIALRADFGCLHLLTPSELERGRVRGVVTALDKRATKFRFMVASRDLQERLPDLFWATVLGPPYVKMFGPNCLISAPAHVVTPLRCESMLLQLTEKMSDVEQNPILFNETRCRVETHLGKEAFFKNDTAASGGYNVPQFEFA